MIKLKDIEFVNLPLPDGRNNEVRGKVAVHVSYVVNRDTLRSYRGSPGAHEALIREHIYQMIHHYVYGDIREAYSELYRQVYDALIREDSSYFIAKLVVEALEEFGKVLRPNIEEASDVPSDDNPGPVPSEGGESLQSSGDERLEEGASVSQRGISFTDPTYEGVGSTRGKFP